MLEDLIINRPNQVFATYIKLAEGFVYLLAIIDLFNRYVVNWQLSNTLEASFCVETLQETIRQAIPDIVNTDHEH